jgi:3-hydroxyacyl-[acyl-carrier-protein] dehydratase
MTIDDGAMDIQAILATLPHRPPMLMVDRVLKLERGKRLVAVKNVASNEPCLQGHFPSFPLFPGVMVIEALAQAAAILAHHSLDLRAEEGALFFFAGIDNARFRRQVVPGDRLTLEIDVLRIMRGVGKFAAVAKVGDEIAAEAQLLAVLRGGNTVASG